MSEDVIPEQFTRIVRLIGRDGLNRLQNAFIVVVGLGAVGSYAVEALARAGIGRLRLVDFDKVNPSNINRQIYALHSTIGQNKVDLAVQRVKDINPACNVEGMCMFAHVDTLSEILAGNPDIIIDAIDSLNPKVELLNAVTEKKLTVVSSMGAALRMDTAAISTAPLADVRNCRLAKIVRKRLRRRNIDPQFLCVYSKELMPDITDEGSDIAPDQSTAPDHRQGRIRQVLGSLPTITGIFGLTAAHKAIEILLDSDG